jgi:hypothetical protein
LTDQLRCLVLDALEGSACRPPGRCKQRPSTQHSQIQTDTKSKIEDEDEFEGEDDYREASCMKSALRKCFAYVGKAWALLLPKEQTAS